MSEPEQTLAAGQEAAVNEGKKALPVKQEARENQVEAEAADYDGDAFTKAAALAVVVIGVALIEFELLAGVALGAAAMAAPQIIPMFRSTARKIMKSSGKGEKAKPPEPAAQQA